MSLQDKKPLVLSLAIESEAKLKETRPWIDLTNPIQCLVFYSIIADMPFSYFLVHSYGWIVQASGLVHLFGIGIWGERCLFIGLNAVALMIRMGICKEETKRIYYEVMIKLVEDEIEVLDRLLEKAQEEEKRKNGVHYAVRMTPNKEILYRSWDD